MYIYIYIYIYIHVSIYAPIYIYVHTYIHIYVYMPFNSVIPTVNIHSKTLHFHLPVTALHSQGYIESHDIVCIFQYIHIHIDMYVESYTMNVTNIILVSRSSCNTMGLVVIVVVIWLFFPLRTPPPPLSRAPLPHPPTLPSLYSLISCPSFTATLPPLFLPAFSFSIVWG